MPAPQAKMLPIGNLENFHRERHIFDLNFSRGLGRVSVVTPNIIRLQYTLEKDWPYKPLLSIEEKEWKSVPIQIKRHPEKLDITTPKLIISMVFRPFNIRVYDHEGHLLCQDNPKCSTTYKGEKITIHKKVPPGASILGLGDIGGDMDRGGKLYNFEMHKASPKDIQQHHNPQISFPICFYKGKDHAVGFFLDNPQKSAIDLRGTSKGDLRLETDNGNLDYYIIIGNDFEEISRSISLLIGNSTLPPRWSLEIMKGLETPLESKTFLEQLNTIREEFLLTSSVMTHQPSKDKTGFWDHRPLELLKSFRRSDQIPHFLMEIEQKFKANALPRAEHDELINNCAFIENQLNSGEPQETSTKHLLLDPFFDAGREFIKQKISPLLEKDLRGLEISDPYPHWNKKSADQSHVRCIQEIIAEDGESVEKLVHEIEAKNLLGYMPNALIQGIYESFTQAKPELRPLLLSTSGYAGIQRYAILRLPHGDLEWDDLPQYLSRILSLNISGSPLTCADIELKPGFDEDLVSKQILMLSFVPLIRLKLSKDYELDELLNSETFLETLEFTFGLRETWLPYLYQLTWQAHTDGLPVLYPTLYFFPEWEPATKFQDQFLVGPHVLVSPFTQKTGLSRRIHLPPGAWADAQTFEVFQGPLTLTYEKENAILPIFFREGCIVPSYDTQTEGLEKSVVVTFFPDHNIISESNLYDDDGDTTRHQSQMNCAVQLKLSSTKKGFVLKLSRRQGRINPSWSSYLLRFIRSRLDIQRVVYNRVELTYFTSLEELAESKMGFFLDDELEMLYVKVPYEREGGVVRF
jgi:alpha-glucosidase